MTLADSCYYQMFSGCTSLTAAPVLPATTLAEWCYIAMFRGCTSLKEAPKLPAPILVNGCYEYMFRGCTSLTTVVTYAQVISATDCLTNWLDGVSTGGDFFNLGTAAYPTGSSGIPSGWTIHTSI